MSGHWLLSLPAFLLALGILISIHEFGHFWVARKLDVKVLKFSIGFGKPLWSRRGKVDDTEYAVAMIPLGGYVRMLDEREGDVKPQELHRAFNRKSVWARIAIVLAGPVANFILAAFVYWIIMMTGITGLAPLLGEITPDTPAAEAGFAFEDRIIRVGDTATPTWSDARIALLQQSMSSNDARGSAIDVFVQTAAGEEATRTLVIDKNALIQGNGDAIARLGIQQWWPVIKPIIGGLVEGGAASRDGLLIDDLVLQVNETSIDSWFDWVMVVRDNPGVEMQVDVLRNGEPQRVLLTPAERNVDGEIIGFIGASENQSGALMDKARIRVSYPPIESLKRGIEKTWDISVLTLRMMGKLVTGQASLDNVSGPISIAQFAGQSASVGMDHYLNFIALISVSLAILNLLPVPMLDGGHLLYFAMEVVTGKPLPEKVQLIGQQVGLALLGCLMILAFYNDILRLVG